VFAAQLSGGPNLLLTGQGDHGNWRVARNLHSAEYGVAEAKWGQKRICSSCGARFYDLQREPLVCPKCGAAVDPAGPGKPRRARATPAPARAVAVAVAEVEVAAVADDDVDIETEVEEDEDEVAKDDKAAEEEDADDDGESAIEDVSELGDDDMADVIDTEIDEEETDR